MATPTTLATNGLQGSAGTTQAKLLPGVHLVASLAKRWLLGTHQGSVDEAHLQSYLNEFVFRFNRRRSRSRGMVFYRLLELAVAHEASALPRLGRQPAAEAEAADATRDTRPPAEHGPPPSGCPWRTS